MRTMLLSFLLLCLLSTPTHGLFAYKNNPNTTTCDAKRSDDPSLGSPYPGGTPCSWRGDQLRGYHINITFTEIDYFMQFNRDKANTTSDPKGSLIFEDAATGLLFKSSPTNSYYAVGTAGGYLNDMIGWISERAGFTYSAYIASGRCNNYDTRRPWHPDYAGEYVEGQKDVYDWPCNHTHKFPNEPYKGRTDAYLGMYFITNGRHTLNDFTVPFLSNKGLSIGMLAEEKGTIFQRLAKQDSDDLWLVAQPFDGELWVCIFMLLIFLFCFLLIVENSNQSILGRIFVHRESQLRPFVQDQVNSASGGFEERPLGAVQPEGFLTGGSICQRIVYYFLRTVQGLLVNNELTTSDLTSEGRWINLTMAMFSLILLAAYISSLTNILTQGAPHYVSHVNDLSMNGVLTCLPGDSAFTKWVQAAYPNLKPFVVTVPHFKEQMDWLHDGRCEAIIAPDTNLEAAENRWLNKGDPTMMKRVIDQSWQYGYKEHAIGVRKDFPELTDTLNYWIHELSLAATDTDNPLSLTYLGNNMEMMFRKAVGEKTVTLGKNHRLGVENFLGPIFVAFGTGLFVTIVSCFNHRDLFAYRSRFLSLSPNAPRSVHNFVKSVHKDCMNEDGTIRMQLLMQKFRNNRYNSEFQKSLTDALLNYYVLTDVPAFRLIKHTRNMLESHLHILDLISVSQRNHFHVNDDYVSHIVRNCNHTIEVLLWRALRESVEATDAAAIRDVQKRLIRSTKNYPKSRDLNLESTSGDVEHVTRARALTEEATLDLRKMRLSVDQDKAEEQMAMEANAATKRMNKRLKSISKMAINLNKAKIMPFGIKMEKGVEDMEDSGGNGSGSPLGRYGVQAVHSGIESGRVSGE